MRMAANVRDSNIHRSRRLGSARISMGVGWVVISQVWAEGDLYISDDKSNHKTADRALMHVKGRRSDLIMSVEHWHRIYCHT